MNRLLALSIAVTGAVVTGLTAARYGMSIHASLQLAAIAGGAAIATGVVGALVVHTLRERSVAIQLAVVCLTPVAAVAIGAVTSANSMFFSEHDLHTLFVVIVAAGTVGVVFSLFLGDRIARSSRALGLATSRIAEGEVFTNEGRASLELAELGRGLEEMSVRLEEARERERAMDASRRELVAWVSHDLRTPLSGIRAMIEALEDGIVDDPETVARYHASIRKEADRLTGLVDDLFELSRINSGTLMLQMERASLGDLVSDALSSAGPTARLKGVKLEGNLMTEAAELDLSVPEMGRVLRNLLENSIRHTPADGTVTVEAGLEDEHAVVSVADSCGGIPDDDIDRVFDVAFRGAASRTPGDEGGGLGLAIARGIVEAHNGSISVQNEGRGCRFRIVLPLSPS